MADNVIGTDIQGKLDDFIDFVKNEFPEFLAEFIEIAKNFAENQTSPGPMPNVPDTPASDWVNVTDDDGTGTGYTITCVGISDEQIAHIRQGVADGIVMEKAGEFLMGFIAGLALAGA